MKVLPRSVAKMALFTLDLGRILVEHVDRQHVVAAVREKDAHEGRLQRART